jgi:hypothetical protein
MGGIASGAGIGFMRGLSTGEVVCNISVVLRWTSLCLGVLLAGHWAMVTFAVVSLGSWYAHATCYRILPLTTAPRSPQAHMSKTNHR